MTRFPERIGHSLTLAATSQAGRAIRQDFEQEDRGVREAGELNLSPFFPTFLFNPA